ncbi:MAG TPA: zf-HC2 domain-containing protein [Actinomycetota bacterium]
MTCDEVREQLAEHLLGTLDEIADAAVRRHLRGCASCRAESAALSEGVSTFARAAHDVEPPEDLRGRVLAVLEEEWEVAAPSSARARRSALLARAAVAVALIASLGWGAFSTVRAARSEDAADRYEAFLGVLGGEDVRVGELSAARPQELAGSAVIYDSKVGQSWVLVLFRAPGWEGEVNVTLVSDDEARIDLHPMEVGPGGEASTWLVTPSDLSDFDEVRLWDESGLIASGRVERA